MSKGRGNNECLCGGNIRIDWDNNDLSVHCDNPSCDYPYPKQLWEDINKDIKEKGTKHIYKGTEYYDCGEIFYVNVSENNSHNIYEAHKSKESVTKWIDGSSVQTIL